MNILLTTHQMADFAGSEIYTYELAKGLSRAGHKVCVYSRYVDAFEALLATEGIELVTNLETVKNRRFDIAHVHHHINALEVRLAFSDLPIFFLSHGAKTFLENPPGIEINITRYGAISERVAKNLRDHGVRIEKVAIVHNIVDDNLFFEEGPIHASPRKALILSNRMAATTASMIVKACKKAKIEVTMVGSSFKRVDNVDLPGLINAADIVFTIGRGVIETMMCGRVPFIFDSSGGDGILTPSIFSQSAKHHFNGQYKRKLFTATEIVKELRKYDQKLGKTLRIKALASYSTTVCIKQLEAIYAQTIKEYRPKKINREVLSYIVGSIQVTRLYTFSRSEERGFLANLRYLKQDFPRLIRSPLFLSHR